MPFFFRNAFFRHHTESRNIALLDFSRTLGSGSRPTNDRPQYVAGIVLGGVLPGWSSERHLRVGIHRMLVRMEVLTWCSEGRTRREHDNRSDNIGKSVS
jgi:hypothetical protein